MILFKAWNSRILDLKTRERAATLQSSGHLVVNIDVLDVSCCVSRAGMYRFLAWLKFVTQRNCVLWA